jgi:hypothetical protein
MLTANKIDHCVAGGNPALSKSVILAKERPWRPDDVQFTYKSVSVAVVAALIAATFSGPADARVKKKKRSSVMQTQQVPSLDGRITGRPRTCGFATFQYDVRGVPYGPYCH